MIKNKAVKAPPVKTGGSKKEDIHSELETLVMMAENWQKSDLARADCDGTEKFIYTDYIEKISQWMLPYVTRMRKIEAITDEEYGEFCRKIAVLTDELREKLQLPTPTVA